MCVCECVHARIHTHQHTHALTQSCLTLCNPRAVTHQAPLSLEFSKQEYWSVVPFPTPEDLLDLGVEPVSSVSPALTGGFFTTSATWEVAK